MCFVTDDAVPNLRASGRFSDKAIKAVHRNNFMGDFFIYKASILTLEQLLGVDVYVPVTNVVFAVCFCCESIYGFVLLCKNESCSRALTVWENASG